MKALVTSDQLLDMADEVSQLASVAEAALQQGVKSKLEAALPLLLEAARHAALREVQERRSAHKISADVSPKRKEST